MVRRSWDEVADEMPKLEAIPIGIYKLLVTACVGKHSKKGHEMFVVTARVAEGEFEGRLIKDDYLIFGPAGESSTIRAKRALQRLGIKLGDFDILPQHLVDRTFTGLVTHEEWNGNIQGRLDFQHGYLHDAEVADVMKKLPSIIERNEREIREATAKKGVPVTDADCPF